MSNETKRRENLRAKLKMREMRAVQSKKQKQDSRRKQRERRYLKRLLKQTVVGFSEHMDIIQYNFEIFMKGLSFYSCKICKKKQVVHTDQGKVCRNCHLFSSDNDMDPFALPECLKGLTYVEKQLIARIHPVVSLYKIKDCQYKYSGNIINFPQNVQDVADFLPHNISDLNSIITLRLDMSEGFKDFIVRRKKVTEALVWLKANNPLYKDIVIDHSRCESLPEFGNVYKLLKGYDVQESECDNSSSSFESYAEPDDDGDTVHFTDVPDLNSFTHKEQVANYLGENVLQWPKIGTVPINEFTFCGYFTLAFPYLFPYGTADYSMPRNSKITFSDYVKHLMLYKDGRFARDERFRYFLMNSEMRWQALHAGNVFTQKNDIFSKMTVQQLKTYLKDHPNVVKNIMFYASRIRSTRPYWNSRCSELLEMHSQLGTPTAFITLSSADFYWPDFYRLLGYNVSDLTMPERRLILSENPLLFESFFVKRCSYYFEECLVKKFNVKDFWYRYEYQHRGSIHLHGLLWLSDSPDVKEVSADKQSEVIDYFNNLVSCCNPDSNVSIDSVHPCQKRLMEITDSDNDYAQLVNCVQKHSSCRKGYCLREKHGTLKCRFKFPAPLEECSRLVMDGNIIKEVVYERNDPLVNRHNRWILQSWRANVDFSFIGNPDAVYRYIAKYASKCEIKSLEYSSLVNSVTSSLDNENESCKKVIRKLLITSCSERDYCSQEVMHYLMGYKFYSCSREFVVVNLKQLLWVPLKESNNSRRKSLFDWYIERPIEFQSYSLYAFSKRFTIRKGVLVKRRKSAIVRLFPRVNINIISDLSEEDVTNLHAFFVPWVNDNHMDIEMEDKRESVVEIFYEICNVLNITTEQESGYFSDDTDTDNESNEKEVLSAYNPTKRKPEFKLGHRKVDKKHKWDCVKNLDHYTELNDLHEKFKKSEGETYTFDVDYKNLNEEQLQVFNNLKEQVKCIKRGGRLRNNFVLVQGSAGTGKSYLLMCMYNYAIKHLGPDSVVILGPTGVCAKHINGRTIHSYCHLGRNFKTCVPITGDDLLKFQKKGTNVKFIFIDEYSMVGCRLLAIIDERLKQMADSHDLFGGYGMYFFGDCNQLTPVRDSPWFSSMESYMNDNGLLTRGLLLVRMITTSFILNQSHRSHNRKFVSFLRRVSTGECVKNDVSVLRERCISLLSGSERSEFSDALTLFCTNNESLEYNNEKLCSNGKAIAIVKAQNNCKVAFKSSDDEADGLTNLLYLCIGAKIMLRRNFNVDEGLSNGTIGYVEEILYHPGERPPKLPAFIIVKFYSFDNGEKTVIHVPFKPALSTWVKNHVRCARVQYPFMLAWSCTVHKSQSLTLHKTIIDVGTKEFTIGLLYVALSRVSGFEDIMLLRAVCLDRLNGVKNSKFFQLRLKFLTWLNEL